jgi:outer membrane protein assembly factor BamA
MSSFPGNASSRQFIARRIGLSAAATTAGGTTPKDAMASSIHMRSAASLISLAPPGPPLGPQKHPLCHLPFFGLVMAVLAVASGCTNTAYLGQNDKLYTGATVHIDKKGEIPAPGDLEAQLNTLIVPEPNSAFLGLFRVKLWLYNVGLFKESMGEPPVLLRSVMPDRVAAKMRTLLENKGYFQADVNYAVRDEEKTGNVQYNVAVYSPYTIGSVSVTGADSPLIDSLRATMDGTVLAVGEPYDLTKLQQERVRIDAALKDKGFFFFAPDLILFRADSSVGEHKVDLSLMLKEHLPEQATRVYTIGDVSIYSGYALNRDSVGVPVGDTVNVDGYTYIDLDKRFDPGVIIRSVFFVKGLPYTRHDHDHTLNRLMNLGVFKFVNIRFVEADSAGIPRLNAHIYLTPLLMTTLRFELQGVSKSNNLAGPVFDSSFRNRNFLRGAELFTLTLDAGFETSFRGTQSGGTSYELGFRAELELPKFLIPFTLKDDSSRYVPRTRLALGLRMVHRLQYYQMFSADASFGYSWKETASGEHSFNPISVTYAHLTNTTQQFKDLLAANPFLRKSFEEQFIIGQTYSFTYADQLEKDRKNHLYFKGSVDLSGSLIHLVQLLFRKDGGTPDNPLTIFGAPYSEYAKVDVDVRHYYNTSDQTSSIASRLIAGIGIAHGNSSTLPYVKQFYIGGGNSVRAFDARSLGPGSYKTPDSLAASTFADQAGDIKLEANIEYRFPIVGIVHGALFLDAGNIWMRKDDPNRPGGTFSGKTFLDEIGVGTGFGLRLDLSFFILRFDLAFPLHIPYLPKGERWVTNQIDFGSPSWRKENLVLNVAIGYPY